jgi:type IV pilus assembly protein PilV
VQITASDNTRLETAKRLQRGGVLLEGLIAILIFSVGILGLVGLQGQSIKNSSDAKYRTAASFLANRVIAEMWVDRSNLASWASSAYGKRTAWDGSVTAALPAGTSDVEVSGTGVTVTVTWQAPGQDQHKFVLVTDVR